MAPGRGSHDHPFKMNGSLESQRYVIPRVQWRKKSDMRAHLTVISTFLPHRSSALLISYDGNEERILKAEKGLMSGQKSCVLMLCSRSRTPLLSVLCPFLTDMFKSHMPKSYVIILHPWCR